MIEQDSHEAQLTPIEREAHAWVRRLTSGDATMADAGAFEQWRDQSPAHRAAFAEARRLWSAFGPAGQWLRLPGRPAADVARARAPTPARRLDRRMVLGGALAASVVGAMIVRPPLGLWPSWSELTADYRTATGEQRQIDLADGVAIAMNTQTSITLRSARDVANRIELLAGEAAVALAGNGSRSFVVEAAGGRAIASTAHFGVRVTGPTGAVTCFDGQVRVECLGRSATIAGRQRVFYDQLGLGETVAIDPALASAWQDGFLIFRATPLAEVIDEINRYRPGHIVLLNAELGRSPVNGRFRIDRTDDVLAQIQQAFGARQRTLPGGIVLLG